MNAHTTSFIFDNADYFLANLKNGGIRVGLKDVACFDFPSDHAEFAKVASLTEANVEDAFDSYYAKFLN